MEIKDLTYNELRFYHLLLQNLNIFIIQLTNL
jgi:hypothetical protein